MRVADLLSEHSLQLRLHTPSSSARLEREISWGAPTELMDPSPFLNANSLVLTTGIGLNFAEARTWDAYVERLTTVPVSAIAFATGTAHRVLPAALVAACAARDVPLLEIPSVVAVLQVDRHIESVLQQERFELINRGWVLADQCARLANDGAELVTLLANVFEATQAPVAVYDSYGSVIAKFPQSVAWPTAVAKKTTPGITRIPLPMGLNDPCLLSVKQDDAGLALESMLSAVASIIALQLSQNFADDTNRQSALRHLLAQCGNWEEVNKRDISRSLRAVGLERKQPTTLLIADMSGELASTSWQLRVALHEAFHTVCLAEFDDRLVAFCQHPRESFDAISARLLTIHRRQPLVIKRPTHSLEELRLAVVHAQDLVKHVDSPQVVPELGLTAVVTATAGRGARETAERFLAPLIVRDDQRPNTLLHTLRVYLRNDAQPSRACEDLFIHRNTLSYRLRKIESLLRIDLNSVEAQATCLLALRLVDIEPY